jgi:hypothetical protein
LMERKVAKERSRLYKNYSPIVYFKGVREKSSGGSKSEVLGQPAKAC